MNEQNLIQNQNRSPSELRENGRKGGRASGVTRSFKAALKKKIRDNPELTDEFINTLWEMFLEEKNVKAAELLTELLDERMPELDKKLKKAQIEKIKAETEEIRHRNDDGSTADDEAHKTLADVLRESAATVWEETDDEN